jgi:hypothetical protein
VLTERDNDVRDGTWWKIFTITIWCIEGHMVTFHENWTKQTYNLMKLGGSPNFIKLLWKCSIKYHHQHPFLLLIKQTCNNSIYFGLLLLFGNGLTIWNITDRDVGNDTWHYIDCTRKEWTSSPKYIKFFFQLFFIFLWNLT